MHLEFFNQPGNLTSDHLMVIQNGEYKPFDSLSEETLRVLYLRLMDDERSHQKLRVLSHFGITAAKAQMRQFSACNFATLNHVDDLDESGHLNFEFVKCPLRNHGCKFNSDVCIKKY